MFVGMQLRPFELIADSDWVAPFVIPDEAQMVWTPNLPTWLLARAVFHLQEMLVKMGYSADSVGKMFGVVVVGMPQGKLGFLAAFSGAWDAQFPSDGFVPPVFNWTHPKGFFRQTEASVNLLTREMAVLNENRQIHHLKREKEQLQRVAEEELAELRESLKVARILRHQERALHPNPDPETLQRWEKESQTGKADYRRRRLDWQARLAALDAEMAAASSDIEALQAHRKEKTDALQRKLFTSFVLTNALGMRKSVLELFELQGKGLPPSGTGDCAAPKLLHYAFQYGLKPLALTEFWWGASPQSALRRHGYFYPICKGKCEPLMPHLLQGLVLNRLPESVMPPDVPKVIFQTPDFLVLQKPSGWLSVPGKTEEPHIVDWLKRQNLDVENFYPVHRLDRDTSGLLLVALHRTALAALQVQFAQRSVTKEYLAWIHGDIPENAGEISLPLAPDWSNRPRQMVCEKTGKYALTKWEKVGERNGQTLLKVFPVTGRTHQIRVHLAHPRGLNRPIVGDLLYGMPGERLALHAHTLSFDHPVTGVRQTFSWPLEFFSISPVK